MSLLFCRLAGAVLEPLRRSLNMVAARPPWAMVYSRAAQVVPGAPSPPSAHASFEFDAAPYVSTISVPAHLADGMDLAAATIRATSSDGILLLDMAETRHCFGVPPDWLESQHLDSGMLQEMFVASAASELDVTRFVRKDRNPLSGELFRYVVSAGGRSFLTKTD